MKLLRAIAITCFASFFAIIAYGQGEVVDLDKMELLAENCEPDDEACETMLFNLIDQVSSAQAADGMEPRECPEVEQEEQSNSGECPIVIDEGLSALCDELENKNNEGELAVHGNYMLPKVTELIEQYCRWIYQRERVERLAVGELLGALKRNNSTTWVNGGTFKGFLVVISYIPPNMPLIVSG